MFLTKVAAVRNRDLAKMLRKLGKPVSLAVNKIDSQKRESLTHTGSGMPFMAMALLRP